MSRSSSTHPPGAPAERYERLLEVQSLMARVSRELGPATDLAHVLRRVLDAIRSLVHFDGGVISLVAKDGLSVAAVDPESEQGCGPASVAGRVVASGVSALSSDLRVDRSVSPEVREAAAVADIRSYLCVPLVCLGDIIGAIEIHAAEAGAFETEHLVLLEGLATQVAGAIESARRYEDISQLEVLKSDFIARVSHELRTPITIMSGFVNTLLSNHENLDTDTRRRMLERVDVATARLSGLIDQLLMLSRLEAGVVAANLESADATNVLEEVRRQAEAPDTVEIESAEGLRVFTDSGLLIRALGFLVDNALKYAGSCRLIASEGVIEVVDRGPGIPDAHRSHVFERFTRATDNTTVPGMGIGLPMARTLLAAAGADLAIEDPDDGVGARMVVRFW